MRLAAVVLALGLLALAGCWGTNAGHEDKAREEDERVERRIDRHPSGARDEIITLAPEAVMASDIRTVEVRTGSAWVTTRVPGRVEFNPNATAVVQTPLEGRFLAWRVNVGDAVRKGDELGRVESPQNLGAPIILKAPLGGEVIERNATLGAWVKPGDKLALITNPTTVWVAADVREDLVGTIRTDAPPTIRVLSFPSETFTGRLLRVGASVERQTRTVEFVFEVGNPDRKLRAGMFTYVSLATDRVEDRLLVPDEAVQKINGKPVVFVEQEPGRYRMTEVRLGRRLDGRQEVIGGVSEGARIVTRGSFVLKSEAARSEFSEEAD